MQKLLMTGFAWKFVAVFALASAPAAVAQDTGKDMAMSFRLSRWSVGRPDSVAMTGYSVSAGAKTRMDMTTTVGQSMTPFLTDGPLSAIMSDSGKTMTYLDAGTKRYMQVRMDEMLAGRAGMKMDRSTPEITVRRIGAGPPILGYQTIHYRIDFRMTMTITVLGKQRAMSATTTSDYFYPTNFDSSDPLASAVGTEMLAMFASSDSEFSDKLKAARDSLPASPPMRISTTTSVTLGAETRVSRTEMDITSVGWVKADPRIFEIPAGYSAVEFPGMGKPTPNP